MARRHYDAEHLAFADAFRAFLDKEVVPRHLDWERDGIVARDMFIRAGASGFLGMAAPEQHGGGGVADFRFNQVIGEQIAHAGVTASGLGISLHNDICLPYFLAFASDEQQRRWLPDIVSGARITAIAMTEPGAGSDLAGMRTTARRDGDSYLVNGTKTFITNGINADLVITAVKTATGADDRRGGMSLLVLERGMPGFERGRNLDKLGLHAQDTAELVFDDVRVPASNLLGDEGQGFAYLTQKLPQERISLAVNAVAEATAALQETLRYVTDRTAFGTTVGAFQNTKFVLAEIATEVDAAQALVDRCVLLHNRGELSAADAAKAKLHCSELQGRVLDRCVQLHGGYGYMTEYGITRRYADARVTRIFGGTSEVMKSVISRSLGL
jgi:alkylation response protein AidB-like acyl-CoA dehydrogenase